MKLPVFTFGNKGICTYCGDPSNSIDHVIPVSSQTNRIRKGKMISMYGPTTFSCIECNNHLGSRYFESFKKRCEWNQWRIETKCEPIIWHFWELKELDHSLKDYIKKDVQKRKWMRFRADFFGTRDYLLNIENILWEIQSVKNDNIPGKFIYSYFSETLRDLAMLGRSSMREDDEIYGL